MRLVTGGRRVAIPKKKEYAPGNNLIGPGIGNCNTRKRGFANGSALTAWRCNYVMTGEQDGGKGTARAIGGTSGTLNSLGGLE